MKTEYQKQESNKKKKWYVFASLGGWMGYNFKNSILRGHAIEKNAVL